jgi:hypothetical protein
MNQDKLRALETELSTTGRTGRLLDCSRQRIHSWRHGKDILKASELEMITAYVMSKLKRLAQVGRA